MTREEATIQALRNHIEALEETIKTLEKEPILNKIRAEIETQEKWLEQAGYYEYNVDIAFNAIKLVLAEMESRDERR